MTHSKVIAENKNVLMICGKMDPASVVVYRIAEELQDIYKNITFIDLECDHPEFKGADIIPTNTQDNFPLLMFYKNSKMMKVIIGDSSKAKIIDDLNNIFFDKE